MKTNFKFGEAQYFNEAAEFNSENPVMKPVFENNKGGVSLVAMKAGQKLDTHQAPFEVMVSVLEGEIDFTMLDMTHSLNAGEFILMGANVPHSVFAKKDSRLLLVKIKDDSHSDN